MAHVLKIAPPEVCLRIYYEASCGEVGNSEIRELYGNEIGGNSIAKIKKEVWKKMIERGMMRTRAELVNVDVLFEVLGLDLEKLEKNRAKLAKLRQQSAKEKE